MARLLVLGVTGIVTLLSTATPVFSQVIRWTPPMAFVYHGVFGGDTNYIVVRYEVSNKTTAMESNSWEVVVQGSNGQQFEDGFHPMVQNSFCKELPDQCPGGASAVKNAMTSKRELLPGSKIDGLAIFELTGSFPDRLTLALKTFEGLQQRTIYGLQGASYAELKPEPKKIERRK
jgi:hypothetical protein